MRTPSPSSLRLLPLLLALVLPAATGCEREQRQFRELPAATAREHTVQMGDLEPGPSSGREDAAAPFEGNAYGISEGQRLYEGFNCVGCHSHGGGGMGPALMDAKWIYGSEPQNIFDTIVEGRPNGMPSFRHRIPDAQVWQIVAYVRSLSGFQTKASTPVRSDDMQAGEPPQYDEPKPPVAAPAEHPG